MEMNLQPTSIVIFGASGDLTGRKLVPALYNNFRKGRLHPDTKIIGFSRSQFTDESFRIKMRDSLKEFSPEDYNEAKWKEFEPSLFYCQGDTESKDSFVDLKKRLDKFGSLNALYYLATAPNFFPIAINFLDEAGLAREEEGGGFRRVIIEKPFGHDIESAKELNRVIHHVFGEKQVYRIDHYLGKETVQNILIFRFGNSIFEPIWNRNYVDHVQITVAETVDVGHRAGYYDSSGVLRDMFQNHILQLLTLIAMEPPVLYEAEALRNEKVKVLGAIKPMNLKEVASHSVRAQYDGYKSEKGVANNTTTPTYAALKMYVNNWRWQGVPFYLRSGKCMSEKISEITVQFRRPPHTLFTAPFTRNESYVNRLSIRIQPDEGIHLRFAAKVPDHGMDMQPVDMNFHYNTSFGKGAIPEAYERLILDALKGDAALFARSDEIEFAWNLIDSILGGWESEYAPPLTSYPRGTWGPIAGEELLGCDGRSWFVTDRDK